MNFTKEHRSAKLYFQQRAIVWLAGEAVFICIVCLTRKMLRPWQPQTYIMLACPQYLAFSLIINSFEVDRQDPNWRNSIATAGHSDSRHPTTSLDLPHQPPMSSSMDETPVIAAILPICLGLVVTPLIVAAFLYTVNRITTEINETLVYLLNVMGLHIAFLVQLLSVPAAAWLGYYAFAAFDMHLHPAMPKVIVWALQALIGIVAVLGFSTMVLLGKVALEPALDPLTKGRTLHNTVEALAIRWTVRFYICKSALSSKEREYLLNVHQFVRDFFAGSRAIDEPNEEGEESEYAEKDTTDEPGHGGREEEDQKEQDVADGEALQDTLLCSDLDGAQAIGREVFEVPMMVGPKASFGDRNVA